MKQRPRSAGAAAILTFAFGASARAAEPGSDAARLVVVPVIIGDDGALSASSIYDDVAKAAAHRRGIAVVGYDEIATNDEAGGLDEFLNCGVNAACIAARLAPLRASLALIVLVDLRSDTGLIALRLLDGETRRISSSSTGTVTEARERLSRELRERASRLFGLAGYPASARILIRPKPDAALVEVDGKPTEGPPHVLELPPGRHRFRALLEGYEAKELTLEVSENAEAEVVLELMREPGILESPWFWIAIGAAITAGATGFYFATRRSTTCVCAGLPDLMCRC
jgi:PEGA domain-containing protein